MTTSRAPAMLLALACLGGCGSKDGGAFKTEVTKVLGEDKSTRTAMIHLEEAGFICTLEGPNNVECFRTRYLNFLSSCVQRVTLMSARRNDQFSDYELRAGACSTGRFD